MGSFIYHKQFSKYLHLKFEKEVIFYGRFPPFQKVGTKSPISEFSKLLFKQLFSIISWTAWPKELMDPILDGKFKAPLSQDKIWQFSKN